MISDAQNGKEVTKYRPISLLNMGGKILEKAMINRISHHIYSTEFLNRHQYVFIPQYRRNYGCKRICSGRI